MTHFGDLLRQFRRQSLDRRSGRPLTQQRLAELLEQTTGISYTSGAISEWERNRSQINKDDRRVLLGLVIVLHECGGIGDRSAADRLLAAGNYRRLDALEAEQVNSNWLEPGDDPPDPGEPNPFRIVVQVLIEWLENPWEQLRSMVAASNGGAPPDSTDLAVLLLRRFFAGWTPWRVIYWSATFLATLAIWHFMPPLLDWSRDPTIITGGGYIAVGLLGPALVAALEWQTDRDHQLWHGARRTRHGWRYVFSLMGALTGYHATAAVLLLFSVVLFDVRGVALGTAGWGVRLLLAVLLVFMARVGARQIPRNMQLAYGDLQFTDGDLALLVAFTAWGPALTGLVAVTAPYVRQFSPLGTVLIVVAIIVVVGLIVWQERRAGTWILPSSFWAVYFGALWLFSTRDNLDILTLTITMSTIVIIAVILHRDRAVLTVGGLLVVLLISGGLVLLLNWNEWWGRGVIALVTVVWVAFGRRYFWLPLSFWLIALAGSGAIYLVEDLGQPAPWVAAGLAIWSGLITLWEVRRK